MNIRLPFLFLTGAMGLFSVGASAQPAQAVSSSSPFTVRISSCQTVYHGYADEFRTAEILATVLGGSPPYRYRWNNDAVTDRINVRPENTSFYYVTVTDRDGREMTAVSVVEAVDVRCAEHPDRIIVCYPAAEKTGSFETICVPPGSVQPILAAGGKLGSCTLATCSDSAEGGATAAVPRSQKSQREDGWIFEILEQPPADWPSLRVYPNPAREIVFIALDRLPTGTLMISLSDNLGRTLLVRRIEFEAAQTFFLWVDDLAPGAYWIKISGAGVLDTRKLIVAGRS